MTISNDFKLWMNDTVTFTPRSSVDKYGKVTFGTATTQTDCHVAFGNWILRNEVGDEVIARGRVHIAANPTVTEDDKITLPGGTVAQRIIAVERKYSFDGAHHTVVYVGGEQ